MVNRKNKQKYKQTELDPIVKRIVKKKVKQDLKNNDQDQEYEDEDDVPQDYSQLPQQNINAHIIDWKNNNQEQSHYQQFLNQLQIKPKNKDNSNENEGSQIQAKFNIKQCKTSQFRIVQIYPIQLIDNLANHFDKDYKRIQQEICIDVEIEQSQNENALDNFFKESIHTLKNTLNNGVTFKEYSMDYRHKQKKLIDIKIPEEDYHIEQLASEYLIKNKQFNLPSDGISQKQVQKGLIDNYFDYIHIDPEEQKSNEFRSIYSQHIRRHLMQVRTTYGFTRCKVLILTPFKGDAIAIIESILGDTEQILNKERYDREFCEEERFMEDDFRIGMAFASNGAIKLYADFDKADLIIASPLGLRLITGVEGDKNREYHFLSSIEILVLDRASAMYMQNWTHLETLMQIINKLPEHKHITQDLNSIRPYFFENMHKFYRQTIIYSNHYFQELNYIRQYYLHNYKGTISNKVYYLPKLRVDDKYQLEFRNFDSTTETQIEQRFQLFKKIWNDIEQRKQQKTMVFVQSYFDFVKLKSHFKRINSSIECVSEYTKKQKVQSIISKFKANKITFIMISERAYFFQVCQLRQMNHVIFYQLPQHSYIFKSIVQDLSELNDKTQIITLFTKYDAYQLESIVGSTKAEEMLAQENRGTIFIL